jgi:hypothetical protein
MEGMTPAGVVALLNFARSHRATRGALGALQVSGGGGCVSLT